jgi:hypothetical protein
MRNKKKNKEIINVVNLAKVYIAEGYKIGQAIEMAQRDIREQEIGKYEPKC